MRRAKRAPKNCPQRRRMKGAAEPASSGSMTADFGGQDRWSAVYETLMNPGDGVVALLESQVRFGVTLYTSEDGNDGPECPILTSVEAAPDNRAAIDMEYGPANPNDETPTGESAAAGTDNATAVAAPDDTPVVDEQPGIDEPAVVHEEPAADAEPVEVELVVESTPSGASVRLQGDKKVLGKLMPGRKSD